MTYGLVRYPGVCVSFGVGAVSGDDVVGGLGGVGVGGVTPGSSTLAPRIPRVSAMGFF
ncbi:MAG TPA: hypothetical protein VGK33_12380 [Chloroflexota bacterium]